MRKQNLEFFALPDEQVTWLREFLDFKKLWCLLRTAPGPTLQQLNDINQVECLDFTDRSKHSLSLIIGNSELTEGPILKDRDTGHRDIDFVRSQGIQFCPAIVSQGSILLEGYVAIMQPADYQRAGIDPGPVRSWFAELTSSFSHLRAPGLIVQQRTSLGTTKNLPSIMLSTGAVQWRASGHHLKQFANGAVEFEVGNAR